MAPSKKPFGKTWGQPGRPAISLNCYRRENSELVANAIEPLPLVLSNDYIYDGGCEYSYVIDLDTNEFEGKGRYPEIFLRFEMEGLTTMRSLELAGTRCYED